MRKIFLAALLMATTLVHAQDPVVGTLKVTFGWAKQKDGTKKSLAGMEFPVTGRPVQATTFRPIGNQAARLSLFDKLARRPTNPFAGRLGANGAGRPGPYAAEQTVYSTEGVIDSYAVVNPEEFVDPSSLDDVTILNAGVNKVWSKLRFAIHSEAPSSQLIIIRWRVFDTKIEAPDGQSDYIDEVADFGGYMTTFEPEISPTYLYEAQGIAQAGCSLSDATGYVATQFRDPGDPTGEGDFITSLYNVYQKDSLPVIGSSEDGWIFDFLPDGIYENSEYDAFATQPPPFANMVYRIVVESTSQTSSAIPTAIATPYGFWQSGTIASIYFSDANTYNVRESFLGSRVDPNTGVDVTMASPTSTPLSIRIQVDNVVDAQKSVQKTYIYRYGGTPGWVLIDTRNTLPGIQNQYTVLYGGAIPLSQFVSGLGEVKVRVVNFRDPFGSRASMIQKLNRVAYVMAY